MGNTRNTWFKGGPCEDGAKGDERVIRDPLNSHSRRGSDVYSGNSKAFLSWRLAEPFRQRLPQHGANSDIAMTGNGRVGPSWDVAQSGLSGYRNSPTPSPSSSAASSC